LVPEFALAVTISLAMSSNKARRAPLQEAPAAPTVIECAQLLAVPSVVSFSMTWSMPKLAAFWRGGKSLKLEALLPIPVGKQRALARDPVDVRSLVAGHAEVVSTDVAS
jgi:hypothetical protein